MKETYDFKAAGEARRSPPGKIKRESPSGWTGSSWNGSDPRSKNKAAETASP
jgi:hypothetical protein